MGCTIYKEEHILYPASLDMLTDQEWIKVKEGEADIGFAWVVPDTGWPGAHISPQSRHHRPRGPQLPPAQKRPSGQPDPGRLQVRLTGYGRILDRAGRQIYLHSLFCGAG